MVRIRRIVCVSESHEEERDCATKQTLWMKNKSSIVFANKYFILFDFGSFGVPTESAAVNFARWTRTLTN